MVEYKIIISDFLKSQYAVSAVDGDTLHDEIKEHINNKELVVLDFSDIEFVITAFLNTSIGRLYESFSPEILKEQLRVDNMAPEDINSLIMVVKQAKLFYSGNKKENEDE